MKNTLLVFCLLMSGCAQKGQKENAPAVNSGFSEADVKSAWVQLTEQEGKWVRFDWCEAENLHIEWHQDTLTIGWGQDATQDKITRITSRGNLFTLEGVGIFSNPPEHKFRVQPLDSVEGVALWWLMDEQEPRILVKESMKEKYPAVKEKDCEEMFDKPQ